jgi:hypothetical protein
MTKTMISIIFVRDYGTLIFQPISVFFYVLLHKTCSCNMQSHFVCVLNIKFVIFILSLILMKFFLWVPNKISCEHLSTDLTYLLWSSKIRIKGTIT